ncbi:MAG: FAD-binding and (Fe-S)-binding domain-containing protein [Alphaproteobacteria bacterium]
MGQGRTVTASGGSRVGDGALAARLSRELEGEVLFDPFSRGRYSTDASHYQIEPIGVGVPKTEEDVVRAIQIAAEEGVPVLPRGGGTSQSGQAVGEALVLDTSKYLNQVLDFDAGSRTVTVEPGLVLERLNAYLARHDLFFPVDPATANRATLGGMAGNNSCGARSIRYGNMVHNVRAVEAVLSDGSVLEFGPVPGAIEQVPGNGRYKELVRRVRAVAERDADEIAMRFPKMLRRVGGYNIDTVSGQGHNMAHLLVGAEGTLAFFTRLTLDLQPVPAHRVLGVCHFPGLYEAMDATRPIVELGPAAVELVDRTMIELARDIPLYLDSIARFVKGDPAALLLVEFAGEERGDQLRRLKRLDELMGTLGFPDCVVGALESAFQREIWEVRKAGLNIMMSMKGDGKPVSFIEDCAVPLEGLADYTDRLNRVFAKYGTTGTWYAHASVGCLHVRPILNLKDEVDVKKMRAIAEEAFAMVREYKGSHSGEHGDGLVRSEFHAAMFGPRVVRALEEVKDAFDPVGLFNPGKIVRPPRMDDRRLFRYGPGYQPEAVDTVLDWSAWGGFLGAVEMCNNNGACRKAEPGVMCPSYRVTRDEQHLTRGRANTLRLALSGQLGRDALTSDAMYDTLALCVSCKGCKRECPTGVDMARMKVEVLTHYRRRHSLRPRERLIAYLPRYAPWAARLASLVNLRDHVPGVAWASERCLGFAARRPLPRWRRDPFAAAEADRAEAATGGREVILLADTFNTYFEPENARAALAVLGAPGYRIRAAKPRDGGRPLCCGRTFLSVGLTEEARAEGERLLKALVPEVERGVPVVGLEPSCLLTLRDELPALLPGEAARTLARGAKLFEEFLAEEQAAGRLDLGLKAVGAGRALVHGHCHQKAFGVMPAVERVLGWIPELRVERVESSCCGMAGAFGYEAEHYDLSLKMAELTLLPAVQAADEDTLIVADGTSCRQQIRDATGRQALHVARILESALAEPA